MLLSIREGPTRGLVGERSSAFCALPPAVLDSGRVAIYSSVRGNMIQGLSATFGRVLLILVVLGVLARSNAVTTRRVRSCIPEGAKVPLGVSTPADCPCLARFAAQSSERPGDDVALDFLIVPEKEARRIREVGRPDRVGDIKFIQRYSALGVKPDIFDLTTSRYVHLTRPVTISENDQFSLIIRSTSRSENCDIEPQFVLEPLPETCPRRIFPSGRNVVVNSSFEPPVLLTSRKSPVVRSAIKRESAVMSKQNIVGGVAPPPADQLQAILSITRSGSIICGGALLSPSWIVTAGHCGVQLSDRVLIGGETAGGGLPYFIDSVHVHPKFISDDQGKPYDIALVKLKSGPVAAKPFLLPKNQELLAENTFVRATGYGSYSESWPTLSTDEARTVDVPVVPMDTCKQYYARRSEDLANSMMSSVQFCAGFDDGMCDACTGDSGSPVTLYDTNGNVVQVGIVSFGVGCARYKTPGVYTFLPAFRDWMDELGVDYSTTKSDLQIVKATSRLSGVPSTEGATFVNVWGGSSDSDSTENGSDNGGREISTVAIAVGAGVGAFLLLMLLALLLYCLCRKQHGNSGATSSNRLTDVEQGDKPAALYSQRKANRVPANATIPAPQYRRDRAEKPSRGNVGPLGRARQQRVVEQRTGYDELDSSEGDGSTTYTTARDESVDYEERYFHGVPPYPTSITRLEHDFGPHSSPMSAMDFGSNIAEVSLQLQAAALATRNETGGYDCDAPSSES